MTYAEWTRACIVSQPVASLPGEEPAPEPPPFCFAPRLSPPPESPGLHGWIEATSNFGAPDCARLAGAFRIPTATGAARAATAADARTAFLPKLSSPATRPARIACSRFFRFAPVTPETHASSDSAQ